MERKFRITVDGKAYNVTVEDLSDSGSLLYPTPGSMTVPSPPPAESAPASPAKPVITAGAGDVVATLGGVVEAIEVSVGQAVKQGDRVLVLEAMKMKSPMIAPCSGNVVSIAVKVGDAVEPGQVLASIG
jgi:biotin carboxyl carrier protein